MRQFTLYIDNEVRGPHTEAEIQELINMGTVVADTPCMPEGATVWLPSAQFVNFADHKKLCTKLKNNRQNTHPQSKPL